MGFVDGLLLEWLYSWAIAFLIAFPTVIFVAPLVARICHYLKNKTRVKQEKN